MYIVVTCSALNLENGEVSYNESVLSNKGYPFGTMASFTCNCGYALSNSDISICQIFGHWCWEPPICKKCKKIIAINLAFIHKSVFSNRESIQSLQLLY